MLIKNKREFSLGMLMAVSFLIVLAIMFMPLFGGENAFKASDRLFNSISKSSTNYFEHVRAQLAPQSEHEVTINAKLGTDSSEALLGMLRQVDVDVSVRDDGLTVTGTLGALLGHIIDDAKLMFENQGDTLQDSYGMPPREAMYMWWKFLNSSKKNLKTQKEFKAAAIMNEVTSKAVEVGYNYFGVESQPATQRAGILSFALVFYVIYTLWWGYAIFHLAHGVGLVMTKGAKQEV